MRSANLLRWSVGMSVAVALYQAALFYQGYETSAEFERVWGYVFPLLSAFWVEEDSRARPEIYRPSFDIGLFIYLIWILYLPSVGDICGELTSASSSRALRARLVKAPLLACQAGR